MFKMLRRFQVFCSLFALLITFSLIAHAQASAPAKQSAGADAEQAIVIEHFVTRADFAADGTGTKEISAVVHVQAEAGVQALAVLSFAYTSGTESVDVQYVRVRKPDGTVVVTPAYNVLDMPAAVTRVAPMYSDIHEKQVTVKALSVGDTLEYEIRYRLEKADVPGQFWFAYQFEKSVIVKDEEVDVTVPRDKKVNVSSPDAAPAIKDEGDKRTYQWHSANLKVDAEKKTQTRQLPLLSIQLSTFASWEDVGKWYRGLVETQAVATPDVKAKAEELTKGLTSEDGKIRAIYDFVSTRFHYVSLSFGTGRYQPHAADDVLDNQYGDCKDKHTLLAALLKAIGVEAWPALINSSRKIAQDVPSPGQFDHVITVVPRGQTLVWLDTTPEVAPYGLLVPTLRDKEALVIPTDKTPLLMKTPADPPFPSSQSFIAEGKLDKNGTYTGHVERQARGDSELFFRIGFRATAPAQWKTLVQQVSYMSGFGGDVSNVTASAPDDTKNPFEFKYDYVRKEYGGWGDRRITPPLPPLGIESYDEDKEKPTEPVFLGAPGEVVYRAKLELPFGYSLIPPTKMDLSNDYAEYHAKYSFEKGVLTAERRFVIKKSKVPLSDWKNYEKFRKSVQDDENAWIYLTGVSGARQGFVSGDADTLNSAGSRALGEHNYEAAQKLLENAVKADPNSLWAWNNLGLAYMGLRKFDDAARALRKQIEVNPKDAYAYNNLGRVLEVQGKMEEARDAFEKQIAVNPQDRWAHSNLGLLLIAQKKYKEAVPELETAASLNGGEATTETALGKAYIELGETEKGVAALDKAVEKTPSPAVFNNVAFILSEHGERLDTARQFAESAVSSLDALLRNVQLKDLQLQHVGYMNLLAMSWDTLGWVHFRQGNLDKAENYLMAAWKLDQHPETGNHLGQLYEKEGKTQLAAEYYAAAVAAMHPPEGTHERLVKTAGSEVAAGTMVDKARQQLSEMRTTHLHFSRSKPKYASAEFFISFGPGGTVDDVKFISGDKELNAADKVIASTKFDVMFPEGEVTKMVRRGVLSCPDTGDVCSFVLILPGDVHSVN